MVILDKFDYVIEFLKKEENIKPNLLNELETFNQELKDYQIELEQSVESKKEMFDKELVRIKTNYDMALNELATQHENEVNQLNFSHNKEVNNLNNSIEKLYNNIEKLYSHIATLQNKLGENDISTLGTDE